MTTGIICEFNPFHDGHKYILDKIKESSDKIICVMSGNFVQRGEFAVYDKFKRAKTALENGADLVLELPCCYSLMSANGFAKYAVMLLESTNTVDEIAFGSECDNVDLLKETVKKISACKEEIKFQMDKGLSYPAARKVVIDDEILDSPNNILAIEYISHTNLPVRSIKRIGKGHDTDDEFYSASAIRSKLSLNEISSIKNCEKAILSKLRTMKSDDFLKFDDVNEGLENRIVQSVRNSCTLEQLYDKIKTKRYTHSRIRRIILKSYLGIDSSYSVDIPYIRVLGFNENGQDILKTMKETAALPIISRYNDIYNLNEAGKRLFELECQCTDLYNLGYKKSLPCGTEQRSQPIILK